MSSHWAVRSLIICVCLFYSRAVYSNEEKVCPKNTVGITVFSGKPALRGNSQKEHQDNLVNDMIDWIKKAPDARLLVLPEFSFVAEPRHGNGFSSVDEANKVAYVAPKIHEVPTTEPFKSLSDEAKKKKAFIQFGILEKVVGEEKEKPYNTALVIGPDGKVVAKHRKLKLAKTQKFDEANMVRPGPKHQIATFDASREGLGTVGIAICADVFDDEDYPQEAYDSLFPKPGSRAREILESDPRAWGERRARFVKEARDEKNIKHRHLIEKYRASEIDLLSVSADWLVEKDEDDGHTKGWGVNQFMYDTYKYINHPEFLTTYERFPQGLPPHQTPAAPSYKQRTDRMIGIAVANTNGQAPGVGVQFPDGKDNIWNAKKNTNGWVKSCVPERLRGGKPVPLIKEHK